MKTFLLVFSVGVAFVLIRDAEQRRAKWQAYTPPASRAEATPPAPAELPAHSGNFVVTPTHTGGYRVRELPPGVSYMRSVGLGGGVAPLPAPPVGK